MFISLSYYFLLTICTEILDFGYPQNTDTDTLKMYITTEGVKSERNLLVVRPPTSPIRCTLAHIISTGGLIQDHHASHWCHVLEARQHQVPQE